LFNVFKQVTVIGIMACGMTVAILGGGLDLSSAAMLTLCSVVNVMTQRMAGYQMALVVSLCTGILCGCVNGFLIGKLKSNHIALTLGTQILYTALALIITKGRVFESKSGSLYSFLGSGNIAGIPVPIIVLIVVFIATGIWVHQTIAGRRLKSVGFSAEASQVAGVKVSNVIMTSYIFNGFIVGIASMVFTARTIAIRIGAADSFLYDVITVVVLGGTSLYGGRGGIVKTLIGLVIFAVFSNGLALLSVPYPYQQMTKGIILVIAVLIDEINRKKRVQF
jgi:ribose transport system permease protein